MNDKNNDKPYVLGNDNSRKIVLTIMKEIIFSDFMFIIVGICILIFNWINYSLILIILLHMIICIIIYYKIKKKEKKDNEKIRNESTKTIQ